MAEVRKPELRIVWSGKDISQDLAPFVKECTFTDVSGDQQGAKDELELLLSNDDGRFYSDWFPQAGDKIEASINISSENLTFSFGVFSVDRLRFRFIPKTLSLRALSYTSLNRKAFQKKTNRSFENVTLSEVAQTLIEEAGLKPVLDGVPDVKLTRVDLRNESIEEFLTRLAKTYGLCFAVKGESAIFGKPQYSKGFTITPDSPLLIDGEADLKARVFYSAAVMEYYAPDKKKVFSVRVGDPEAPSDMVKKIYGIARSKAEAETRCKEFLANQNQGAETVSLTLYGSPVSAGETISLSGFGKLDGNYRITRAVHRIIPGSGWRVNLSLKKVKE